MKILLIGEFSNVHWTLANALRQLGHEVTVVSDGNRWREYPTDVKLYRKSTSTADTLRYAFEVLKQLTRWRGYDVVQLINPVQYLEFKAKRLEKIYDYLRRYNKKIFITAAGDDFEYVYDSYVRRSLRYCDFYTPDREIDNERNRECVREWLETDKRDVCQHICDTCNGIISVLYEYDVAYRTNYAQKTQFIPLPIDLNKYPGFRHEIKANEPVRFFIGIDQRRTVLKGTDILYSALKRVKQKYPEKVEVIQTESLPFSQYIEEMKKCDVLLDQLYSYTPAMNALQAMAMGLVAVSGGEEEQYDLIEEKELRPIINVLPNEEDVYRKLEQLVLHPERIAALSEDSQTYVKKHHDHIKVAQRYIDFWTSK